jgi:hypothetical protein
VSGQRIAGRVLPARHYGSVDVFLEAFGRAAPVTYWSLTTAGARMRHASATWRCSRPGLVSNEDVVFGDDGVLLVAAERVDRVLATAYQIWQTERAQAGRIRAGETLRQQTAFEDYLARRAADPSYTFRQHLRRVGGAVEEWPGPGVRTKLAHDLARCYHPNRPGNSTQGLDLGSCCQPIVLDT